MNYEKIIDGLKLIGYKINIFRILKKYKRIIFSL